MRTEPRRPSTERHTDGDPAPASPVSSTRSWLLFGVILAVAFVLRLAFLGGESFWVDEVFQVRRAKNLTEFPAKFLQLLPTAVALGLHESEWMARLPSALFSTGEIALVYLLGRRLFPRTGTVVGLWAMGILALLPIHVWYGQEARWYAQWSFLITLSYLLMVNALESNRPSAWFGYAVAAVLALYTFLVTILAFACQGLTAGLRSARRGGRFSAALKPVAVLAIVLLMLSPIIVPALLRFFGNPTGTPRPTRVGVIPYTFFAYVAGFSVGPTVRALHDLPRAGAVLMEYPEVLLYAAVFTPLVALSAWRLFTGRRAAADVLLPWALALPILAVLAAVVTGGTYNVRYGFPAAAGFSLMLAFGISSLPRLWRIASAFAVFGLFGYALFNYYFVPRYDKEDVRSAVQTIRDSRVTSDPVLWVGHLRQPLDYYAPDLDVAWLRSCDPAAGSATVVPERSLRSVGTLWLAIGRDWDGEAADCIGLLERSRDATAEFQYPGVRLLRFEPSGAGT